MATIQSFPAGFVFAGDWRQKIKRIGNSVPPLLMKAIAENLRKAPFMQDVKIPTVISTFAGCGGSSLGYKMAGFHELLAVEWDDNAVETFKLNFPEVPVYHGDIAKLSGAECMKLAGGIKPGELDVLDGSPPCQGFSTAGKRKYDDPRNSLFKEYARLLAELQPKCFVMENVTGMVKGHMKQAYLQIIATLRACGYKAKGEVLNAMYYGVPQSRQRVIIIGVRNDLAPEPSHPKPQTKPITVREALDGCTVGSHTEIKSYREWTKRLKPGQSVQDIHPKNFGFNIIKLDNSKPSPTITKTHTPAVGLLHPTEDRFVSIPELKRLSSLPDSFRFPINTAKSDNQNRSAQWSRIGNSVPPLLMKAIATHIKTNILDVASKAAIVPRESNPATPRKRRKSA